MMRLRPLIVPALALASCGSEPPVEKTVEKLQLSIDELVQTAPGPRPVADFPPKAQAVARHCQRCHMLGDPQVLTQQLWVNAVLPEMGCYMGLHHIIEPYARYIEKGTSEKGQAEIDKAGLYPAAPTISKKDWDAIVTYYLENSPTDSPANTQPDYPELPAGKFRTSFIYETQELPQLTLLKIDPDTGEIHISDHTRLSHSVLDASGAVLRDREKVGTFVDLAFEDEGDRLLDIGILTPSDRIEGRFWALDGKAPAQTPSPLLKRPVDFVWADLDADGTREVVVAEYGNKTGRLALYKQQAGGNWGRKVLNARSGNRIVKARDMNADGRNDLVVLQAQESEAILIYYNEGGLSFRESTVVKNPSYWGSNDFEVTDVDGDGHDDLVLANGDNADSTPILKNFHAITVYRNQGDGSFESVQTIPFHGAYGVRALDYDGDGDLDLAAFSAFPDFNNDQPSLLFLKNDGTGRFSPFALGDSALSRWMVMDAGDVDGDGDEDVLLGSHLPGPSKVPPGFVQRARSQGGAILFLENLSIDSVDR